MAQRTAAALTLFAVLLASGSNVGRAQSLQRLTVLGFDLSTDAASPRVDVPFHLMLILRVRERVTEITNLDLPILSQLELLGDERETRTLAQGTQYRETVTVVAHDGGTVTISPATLQGIDARDGKPKQWFSNGLRLQVSGAASHAPSNAAAVGTALLAAVRLVFWFVLSLAGIACVVAIVVVLTRHRRAPAFTPPAPPPPPRIVRTPRQRAQDALTVLRAERTRSAAIAVRAAIWRMAGASDGETLADVLRRTNSQDRVTVELLVALERSAFTYEEDLQAAIEDACGALERYIESAA